jgi:hypothetical protein
MVKHFTIETNQKTGYARNFNPCWVELGAVNLLFELNKYSRGAIVAIQA